MTYVFTQELSPTNFLSCAEYSSAVKLAHQRCAKETGLPLAIIVTGGAGLSLLSNVLSPPNSQSLWLTSCKIVAILGAATPTFTIVSSFFENCITALNTVILGEDYTERKCAERVNEFGSYEAYIKDLRQLK